MKLLRNQAGFSAIEVAFAVIVMGLVGGTGAYVYNTNQQADETLSESTQQSAPPASVKQVNTEFLRVKEWGVKIPLSQADAGAYYTVNADGQKEPQSNITVFAKEADTITGPTGASCKGEYIAYMLRLKANDPQWNKSEDDSTAMSLFSHRKTIGNYTYAIATKKQYGPECYNKNIANADYLADEATADKFSVVVQAFVADFKGITTDTQ